MKITYYGHSCLLVEAGGKRLLFDPFVTGNPLVGAINVNSIRCDYILVTHVHSDHIGDLETVMQHNPNAVIIGIWEVSCALQRQRLCHTPDEQGRLVVVGLRPGQNGECRT